MEVLTIGRIVHYHQGFRFGQPVACIPAIVGVVLPSLGEVGLYVFDVTGNITGARMPVRYSSEGAVMTWHWPRDCALRNEAEPARKSGREVVFAAGEDKALDVVDLHARPLLLFDTEASRKLAGFLTSLFPDEAEAAIADNHGLQTAQKLQDRIDRVVEAAEPLRAIVAGGGVTHPSLADIVAVLAALDGKESDEPLTPLGSAGKPTPFYPCHKYAKYASDTSDHPLQHCVLPEGHRGDCAFFDGPHTYERSVTPDARFMDPPARTWKTRVPLAEGGHDYSRLGYDSGHPCQNGCGMTGHPGDTWPIVADLYGPCPKALEGAVKRYLHAYDHEPVGAPMIHLALMRRLVAK